MDYGITFYLLLVFVCLIGVLAGVKLDQKCGPNDVLPECVGAIQIYFQDGEAYLFLNTKLTPNEIAKHHKIVLNVDVETQDPQRPL